MADGILCKHCGFQETSHEFIAEAFGKAEEECVKPTKKFLEGQVGGSTVRIKGYRQTLAKCLGYEPEDQDLADELRNQAEQIEEQIRTRKYGRVRD